MFERPHHRRVAQALAALDADLLANNHCLFGGGTAIALRYGEYRESVDIDFLVSSIDGYRQLRQLLTGSQGLRALARKGAEIHQATELRADQYGIRSSMRASDVDIKFEIVLEARIELEPPGPQDRIDEIATLTALDMATSKLLANSDRWADDSVFSRDLIDLAMMAPGHALMRQAAAKARLAYGESIDVDLAKAAEALLTRQGRMDRCMAVLQMTQTVTPALLRQRIKALLPRPARTRVDVVKP
ncbi:Nucleotidyl transferase AbiEii toxin, Type IV TA system [Variovorax sp. OK605]|uniref:nucleotidyl transferase AbiEii/AbiGii toxin family protein n=1 Tax=Variovorax sp. OK605 TaxID=1855317 RepID=UPI0008E87693|nr:nucleotidyl transferase AbiEii/AbiGii toxin family protein [Variovorax sp. OK605]SFP62205.1 Nucleotidyl transferase AbiEii toxin, Type IV TA system [Variovorax sp. OK605]